MTLLSRHAALARLTEEADRYLAGLIGPGIAEVRAGLARWRGGALLDNERADNAVIDRWMPLALSCLAATHAGLAAALDAALPCLRWLSFDGYPAESIGRDFPASHAYASLFGETGAPFFAEDWDMGLFLIAPHVVYRDHRHPAPELYAPLTGPHGWRFGAHEPLTILPAHVPVWNEPMRPHMTKAGSVPFLCLYAWTKNVNAGVEVVSASDWAHLDTIRVERGA